MVKDCGVWWLNLELHNRKEGNEERENFSLKLSMFSMLLVLVAFVQNFRFIYEILHNLKHLQLMIYRNTSIVVGKRVFLIVLL